MKIKISYNELFYLGNILDADYLDYIYFSAIDDIDSEREVLFANAQNSLSEKGLLSMDFSGNIKVDEELEKLLQPLFFSLKESELSAIRGNDVNSYSVNKLHYLNEALTSSYLRDNDVELSNEGVDFDSLIKSLDLENENTEPEVVTDVAFDSNAVIQIIMAKNANSSETAYSAQFAQTSEGFYKATEQGFVPTSLAEIKNNIRNIVMFREEK